MTPDKAIRTAYTKIPPIQTLANLRAHPEFATRKYLDKILHAQADHCEYGWLVVHPVTNVRVAYQLAWNDHASVLLVCLVEGGNVQSMEDSCMAFIDNNPANIARGYMETIKRTTYEKLNLPYIAIDKQA